MCICLCVCVCVRFFDNSAARASGAVWRGAISGVSFFFPTAAAKKCDRRPGNESWQQAIICLPHTHTHTHTRSTSQCRATRAMATEQPQLEAKSLSPPSRKRRRVKWKEERNSGRERDTGWEGWRRAGKRHSTGRREGVKEHDKEVRMCTSEPVKGKRAKSNGKGKK